MKKKTVEEYVETIYVLEKTAGRAQTGMISSEMGVKPPSVTEMLRKLEGQGLVNYETYGGATLTAKGLRMAQTLMKKHRVIASLLEIIGVERERAEIDACQIEHHVSDTSVAALEKFVKFVQEAPETPLWIQHFRRYCTTGQRTSCKLHDDPGKQR
jgi:DtxR family Mn-dependent transcriptional regulator